MTFALRCRQDCRGIVSHLHPRPSGTYEVVKALGDWDSNQGTSSAEASGPWWWARVHLQWQLGQRFDQVASNTVPAFTTPQTESATPTTPSRWSRTFTACISFHNGGLPPTCPRRRCFKPSLRTHYREYDRPTENGPRHLNWSEEGLGSVSGSRPLAVLVGTESATGGGSHVLPPHRHLPCPVASFRAMPLLSLG